MKYSALAYWVVVFGAIGFGCSSTGSDNSAGAGAGTATGSPTTDSSTSTNAPGSTSSTGTSSTSSVTNTATGTGGNTTTASGGGGSAATSAGGATSTSTSTSAGGGGAASTGAGGATGIKTIFTIVLENHDYAEVVGSSNAPYINGLIGQYGLATNYFDSGTHPSLPNYLYMISGDTQYGGPIDEDPDGSFPKQFPVSGDNLGHQMTGANIKWRSYQESAGGNCVIGDNGNYAPKHDPFLYFSNIQNNHQLCSDTNVDLTRFAGDLASGQYQYMWITPNLVSDGHDPVDFLGSATDPEGSLRTCDTWLSNFVPTILASTAFQQGGVLFITWDEAEGRNGDDGDKIPMIVVSPLIKSAGFTSATHFTHAAYLATVEDVFGLPRLGAASGSNNLFEFLQ